MKPSAVELKFSNVILFLKLYFVFIFIRMKKLIWFTLSISFCRFNFLLCLQLSTFFPFFCFEIKNKQEKIMAIRIGFVFFSSKSSFQAQNLKVLLFFTKYYYFNQLLNFQFLTLGKKLKINVLYQLQLLQRVT